MEFDTFVDTLKELVRQPSVVGAEHSFFRVLQRALEERGARVYWYEGLLVAEGKDPHSGMFSAHIDRHGLMCTGPNEFQYAAFVAGSRSDLLGNSVSESLMNKISDRFQNVEVMAYEPWSGAYRGKGRIKHSYICEFRNNLIFEVEGLEYLVAGTPLAFADRLRVVDGRFMGQLDNVLTTAALVHLYELGYEGTTFFTAGEEAGRSWRYLLEWFRRFGGRTNRLIVVDTSPFPDIPTANQQLLVLRHKDANAPFDESATALLQEACSNLGIPILFKDTYVEQKNKEAKAKGESIQSLGSTELGRIVAASGGLVHGTTLQIPTTGYHTVDESAAVEACEAFLQVALAVSQTG